MAHQNIPYLSLAVSVEDKRIKDPDLRFTEKKLVDFCRKAKTKHKTGM